LTSMEYKQVECQQLPGFEGVEKNLKIEFLNGNSDCRRISRKSLDSILTEARCTIIGFKSTRFFDAYVLSESSLFVYPHKMILKTCGTTRLLSCLPTLIECAKQVDCVPVRVLFSRCNFIFPHVQPVPHCNFDMEVEHLDKFFSGTPHILGPINGARWHLYTGDFGAADRIGKLGGHAAKEQVLEIAMFDLDRSAMAHFYRQTYSHIFDAKESDEEAMTKHAGAVATRQSGIADLLPDFEIDWHLFNPCGYSCNGLRDESYFTIHVTPEPHCSFVSFETNLVGDGACALINKVLAAFRPGRFCVLLMEDGVVSNSRLGMSSLEGYAPTGITRLSLHSTSAVTSAQYTKCKDRVCLIDTLDAVMDSGDSPSSDTDADGKDEKTDKKKKKRKRKCKKKKKKMPSASLRF